MKNSIAILSFSPKDPCHPLLEDGETETITRVIPRPTLNLSIDATSNMAINPSSQLIFEITCEGEIVKSENIQVHIWNDQGFNITTRPTKQSNQVFTIEYQPLVESKSALLILGVVAVLWFSEGISLVATSILIPILIVLANISGPQEALMSFFDPAVALILGLHTDLAVGRTQNRSAVGSLNNRVTHAKHMIQHQGGPEFCDDLTTTHVLNMTPMKPIGYSNGLEKMRALVAEITEGEIN